MFEICFKVTQAILLFVYILNMPRSLSLDYDLSYDVHILVGYVYLLWRKISYKLYFILLQLNTVQII